MGRERVDHQRRAPRPVVTGEALGTPRPMKALLALDQGTTSSRALVIAEDGRVLASAGHEFAQHFPEPGWVEHDPEDLFRTLVDSGREAIAKSGLSVAEIAGIGITNQRETTVVWDRKSLRAVAPAVVWQDRRTAERC